MNPNQGIFDRTTRLQTKLASIHASLNREASKRLSAAMREIRLNLIGGFYPGPFETTARMVANDVAGELFRLRDWYLDQLRIVATDINSRMVYLITGKNRRSESDQSPVYLEADDDEEDIADMLQEIGETLLLLGNFELLILMMEWRWKGFTLQQQWDNFITRQHQLIFQSLMGSAAQAQLDAGSYQLSASARQSMAEELQRRVIGTRNSFTTIGGIASTMDNQLWQVFGQIVQATTARNPRWFAGVRWSALFENTCPICAGLHGQWFPIVDGVSTAPAIPQHAHCHCWLVPEIRGLPAGESQEFREYYTITIGGNSG